MFNAKNKDPFQLFHAWIDDAKAKEPNNPTAMCLSTVSHDCKPSSRMVLLKDYDEQGFVFYTNGQSRKGEQLSHNPNVALNFYWKTFQRQIRIEGEIEIVPKTMTQNYFNSRPRGSQIASYASDQSRPLKDKAIYEDKIKELENKFQGMQTIPCPDHWNGYKVIPTLIEFWVEGEFRTHDRFMFTKNKNEVWEAERLYP